jgi:glycosyltransferase involved in cell wall biosynthesis
MLITIGILAHNEADRIRTALESLFAQSVFSEPADAGDLLRWHVVVVPNGCTDDTAQIARKALQQATGMVAGREVSFLVESLDRPGKSNAWNELIHHIASPETDIFVLMDADIELGHKETIANCIKKLLDDASALVVVDQPLKDFTRKQKLSPTERLSAQASKMYDGDPPGISGQFYCARAATLRQVWMPLDISVEDGFLAAMVTSDFFRGEPDPYRIARAAEATHYFEGLSDIRALIKHEARLVIGTLLNCYLCWDTLLFVTPSNGDGAGPLIRDLNRSKPDWYAKMMANEIAARGRWVIPRDMVFRRFIHWRRLPWSQRLPRIPLTLAAFLFDLVVLYVANRKMVSGRAIGYW